MKVLTLVKIANWIVLGSLLLIAACANGGGGGQYYRPSSYPVYQSPYYYPDLRYEAQDPQFWQLWQNSQGGG
jgi:hypothetical protein